MAVIDSTLERPDALTESALHQCISTIDGLATAGFQEVAAVLQLISHQLEADPPRHKDIFTIRTALNAVFEMTERYRNQMQWVASPFDEDPDNPQTGDILHLQNAIVDMYELANAGFSEINAVARLTLEQLESGHDWKQPGIAITALIKTAYRYQTCVNDQVALVERSECVTEPPATPRTPDEVDRLQAAVETMDLLSQGGFSEISAIAKLALISLELPAGYQRLDVIATAFEAIRCKAEDMQNCINVEAEQVGCNYTDNARTRRFGAELQAREQVRAAA